LKTNGLQTNGIIIQKQGGDYYQVELDNGSKLRCKIMSRFRITDSKGRKKRRPQITVGDKVKVEIHPQDFSKGMLIGFEA
jgi:translation initiation factor IF-1